MKGKILFVGGTWDLNGGKSSKIVDCFAKYIKADVYNGGNYDYLKKILDSCTLYDVVIWWANVDNGLPKIRNVKEINYKTMLVSSKRNDDNKYSFHELLQRSFELKANLTVEFTLQDGVYNMMLFDPLGNAWYDGTDIKLCAQKMLERLDFIKNITRVSTVANEENVGALAWFFNMFKSEMYKSLDNSVVPIKEEFLGIVKNYAVRLARATFQTNDVKRFLGNASFRCPKGFPSFRDGKYIFVSRRNVNKEYIGIEDFVPVYEKNDKIYYCGDFKPSVDTPIQVKLYAKLPKINYMIHTHCYIKDAPYTETALPCGAIEEVYEVLRVIETYYENDFDKEFYVINLRGHGSIMLGSKSSLFKNIEIVGRNLPERMY